MIGYNLAAQFSKSDENLMFYEFFWRIKFLVMASAKRALGLEGSLVVFKFLARWTAETCSFSLVPSLSSKKH